jgi:transposase
VKRTRNPHAAGIDIGNESHYVAVPPNRNSRPVRRFGCTTAELKAMGEWLKQSGIRTVAMQSTGVYWIAVYDILEEAGLQVYLVNARETKISGRIRAFNKESALYSLVISISPGRCLPGPRLYLGWSQDPTMSA